jgi:hypothetical protein
MNKKVSLLLALLTMSIGCLEAAKGVKRTQVPASTEASPEPRVSVLDAPVKKFCLDHDTESKQQAVNVSIDNYITHLKTKAQRMQDELDKVKKFPQQMQAPVAIDIMQQHQNAIQKLLVLAASLEAFKTSSNAQLSEILSDESKNMSQVDEAEVTIKALLTQCKMVGAIIAEEQKESKKYWFFQRLFFRK